MRIQDYHKSGRKVVIFGLGDLGECARVMLDRDSPHQPVAFTIDGEHLTTNSHLGLPVVPFERLLESHPPNDFGLLVAVGYSRVNRGRVDVFDRCKSLGYSLVSYFSSRAVSWDDFELGENTYVFEQNNLQPFVQVGANCVLWSANHIGHHTRIGDHCFLASHIVISGRCSIGERCFIGVNATFRDGITVADDNVIGAGSVIMRDTAPGDVYRTRSTEVAPMKSWDVKL